jgi:hypothetical protein
MIYATLYCSYYTTSFLISKFRDAIWARGFWRYGVGGDTVLQAQRISDCRSYAATRVGTSVGFALGEQFDSDGSIALGTV